MTQVAIIGCGIIGAAIAYELSLVNGLRVALFEQQTPAAGATGAALGVMMGIISQKKQGRAWKLRHESLERYETLIPELEALTGLTIPYNRQGILLLYSEAKEQRKWEKLQQIRHSQGLPLELWSQEQLQLTCPHLASDRVVGAVYSPRDRQLNPTALTQALVAGAAKNGVDCHFGVKIEKIATKPLNGSNLQQCYQIEAGNITLEVDSLVITAGLGTLSLTQSLSHPIPLIPVLGQALQVKLPQSLGNSNFQPVITAEDVHLVPLGKGEYWIGATVEFPDATAAVTPNPQLLETIKQTAIAICPPLAEAKIIRTWFGKRPRPQGQPAPIIDRLPPYSNIWLASGHYRNGILLAPATALAIRDRLLPTMFS